MSATLAEARRAWIHAMVTQPDAQQGLTHRGHQEEYLVPVFEDTPLKELALELRDRNRYVIVIMRRDLSRIRYQFNYSMDDARLALDIPGIPPSIWQSFQDAPPDKKIPESWDSDMTFGEFADMIATRMPHPESVNFEPMWNEHEQQRMDAENREARRSRRDQE